MLLTISTTHQPATDLGYLLHKHPNRCQSFSLSFGEAHVFYPEATKSQCTAALLLDINPVKLVRKRTLTLDAYVNDRPYVASSFFSVAISQVFGTALGGRCKDKPELVETAIPLVAKISVLPCHGGEGFLRQLFEPLGYQVSLQNYPLDETFPEWGDSLGASQFQKNIKKHFIRHPVRVRLRKRSPRLKACGLLPAEGMLPLFLAKVVQINYQ